MLKVCNATSVDELIRQAIPSNILDRNALEGDVLSDPLPEHIFLKKFKESFAKNKNYKSYLGCGFYPCIIPTVIQRNLLENPGWYTAYTPYQA